MGAWKNDWVDALAAFQTVGLAGIQVELASYGKLLETNICINGHAVDRPTHLTPLDRHMYGHTRISTEIKND